MQVGTAASRSSLIVMEFNIPAQMKQQIKQQSNAVWKQESIQYLGIYVASEITSLAHNNLIPVIKMVKNILANWSKLILSWFGRIADIKMYAFSTQIMVFPFSVQYITFVQSKEFLLFCKENISLL